MTLFDGTLDRQSINPSVLCVLPRSLVPRSDLLYRLFPPASSLDSLYLPFRSPSSTNISPLSPSLHPYVPQTTLAHTPKQPQASL
jgi:hypothetical protein